MSFASHILSEAARNASDTGDTAVYSGSTINGTFVNEYIEMDLATGAVSSAKPAFECLTSLVFSAAKGYALIVTSPLHSITSASYTVASVQHAPADLGPGMTRLILKKT